MSLNIMKPVAFFVVFLIIITVGVVVMKQTGSIENQLNGTRGSRDLFFTAVMDKNESLVGGVNSFSVTALNNTWLDFNTSSYVDVGDFVVHEPENITILAWAKPSTTTGSHHIVNKNGGNSGYILYQSGTSIAFLIGDGTNTNFSSDSGEFQAGRWDYMGGYFNTAGGLGTSKVLINGVAGGDPKTLQSGIDYGTEVLSIGREEAGDGSHFNGSIDEVRIYNRTLPVKLVKRLKNESVHGDNLGQGITIVYYHQVTDPCSAGTQVCLSNFTDQLDWYQDVGFETITYDNIYDWKVNQNFSMPEKPLIITFDDGHRSVCGNASSEMTSRGFVGVIGVITNNTLTDTTCSWQDFSDLIDIGWQMASHSVNHTHSLAINVADRAIQFDTSKNNMVGNLSITPSTWIYPYNENNITTDIECESYYNICTGGTEDMYSDHGINYEIMSLTRESEYGLTRFQISNTVFLRNITDTLDIWSGLVLRYDMDENQGAVVLDTSAEQKNGTNSGGAWKNDGVNTALTNLTQFSMEGAGGSLEIKDWELRGNAINVSYTFGTQDNSIASVMVRLINIFIAISFLIILAVWINRRFNDSD